jgi:hypothetical protein
MEEEQHFERFDVDNDFEGGQWIGGEFFATGRRRKRQQVCARHGARAARVARGRVQELCARAAAAVGGVPGRFAPGRRGARPQRRIGLWAARAAVASCALAGPASCALAARGQLSPDTATPNPALSTALPKPDRGGAHIWRLR